MKKTKAYFGKNKRVNRFGKTTNLPESVWAVPRILRKYFTLQLKRHFDMQQLKLLMNGSSGAIGRPPANDGDFFEKLLQERRQLKQQFASGNF